MEDGIATLEVVQYFLPQEAVRVRQDTEFHKHHSNKNFAMTRLWRSFILQILYPALHLVHEVGHFVYAFFPFLMCFGIFIGFLVFLVIYEVIKKAQQLFQILFAQRINIRQIFQLIHSELIP